MRFFHQKRYIRTTKKKTLYRRWHLALCPLKEWISSELNNVKITYFVLSHVEITYIAYVFIVYAHLIDNLHMVISIIYRLSYLNAWIRSNSLWKLTNLKWRMLKYSYLITHALIAVLLLLWLHRFDSSVIWYLNVNDMLCV